MKTTFHRDGTVTYWSVYEQCWVHIAADLVGDRDLATLPEPERRRIRRMAEVFA